MGLIKYTNIKTKEIEMMGAVDANRPVQDNTFIYKLPKESEWEHQIPGDITSPMIKRTCVPLFHFDASYESRIGPHGEDLITPNTRAREFLTGFISVKTEFGVHQFWLRYEKNPQNPITGFGNRFECSSGKWVSFTETATPLYVHIEYKTYFNNTTAVNDSKAIGTVYYYLESDCAPWSDTQNTYPKNVTVTIHDMTPSMFEDITDGFEWGKDGSGFFPCIWPVIPSDEVNKVANGDRLKSLKDVTDWASNATKTFIQTANMHYITGIWGGFDFEQADWEDNNPLSMSYIKNKPPFVAVYTDVATQAKSILYGSTDTPRPSQVPVFNPLILGYRIVNTNLWIQPFPNIDEGYVNAGLTSTGKPYKYFAHWGYNKEGSFGYEGSDNWYHQNNCVSVYTDQQFFFDDCTFYQDATTYFWSQAIHYNSVIIGSEGHGGDLEVYGNVKFGGTGQSAGLANLKTFHVSPLVDTTFAGSVEIIDRTQDGYDRLDPDSIGPNRFVCSVPAVFLGPSVHFYGSLNKVTFDMIPTIPTEYIPNFV